MLGRCEDIITIDEVLKSQRELISMGEVSFYITLIGILLILIVSLIIYIKLPYNSNYYSLGYLILVSLIIMVYTSVVQDKIGTGDKVKDWEKTKLDVYVKNLDVEKLKVSGIKINKHYVKGDVPVHLRKASETSAYEIVINNGGKLTKGTYELNKVKIVEDVDRTDDIYISYKNIEKDIEGYYNKGKIDIKMHIPKGYNFKYK